MWSPVFNPSLSRWFLELCRDYTDKLENMTCMKIMQRLVQGYRQCQTRSVTNSSLLMETQIYQINSSCEKIIQQNTPSFSKCPEALFVPSLTKAPLTPVTAQNRAASALGYLDVSNPGNEEEVNEYTVFGNNFSDHCINCHTFFQYN